MYENRLNTVGCGCGVKTVVANTTTIANTTNTTTANTTVVVQKVEPITIDNVKCGTKNILSIDKIGDKVVVMYDDCTYQTADVSVVTQTLKDLGTDEVKALTEKVTKLETALTSGLESKADTSTVDALTTRVTALEDKTKVLDTLITIQDSNDNDIFKAFPLTNTGE